MPDIQHISPINHDIPTYGSARSRSLSLHTLSDIMSDRIVERKRIDPNTNIVQATERLSELEPTPSDIDFDVNKMKDLNSI